MRRHILLLPLLCLLLPAGAVPRAQQPPAARPPADQRPGATFKVEINYVEIDAVVTDGRGNFVRDLTKEDFTVVEEGKPQSVTAFTLVDLPIERADPPLFRGAPIEPDVASNREPLDGRVFVLVLDDLQTHFQRTRHVRAAASQFVRKHVGANDMVAIVTTGGGTRASQEFTASRSRLLAAIGRFSGQKLTGGAPDIERASRARNLYDSLRALAEYLGAIRGRRKAILWFGEGVEYDIDNVFASQQADVVRGAMLETIAAATRANVSFYGVDARGIGAGLDEAVELTGLPDDTADGQPSGGVRGIQNEVRRGQDSLRTVSSETGGFAVVNQTSLDAAFERIVRENSSYYVLGYYSTDDRRDGKFRNVQVRVKRPGLEVRARKGYTAPRGRPGPAASPAVATAASPEVREALRSALPTQGLNLSVFAAPFAGKAPKASLALVVELDPGQLKFVQKDGAFAQDLEIVAIALDASGKLQDGARDQAPLRLSQRSHDTVVQNGVRFTRRLDVPPGRYQVRVAVREGNEGAIGSVSLDLDVPDFAKSPLAMSGLALASAFASRTVTANPDPGFKDVLPTSPTALRIFPRGDTLSLYLDVHDNQKGAHRVAIRTTVTGDDGRAVFSADDERRSEDLGGAGGGYGHTATVPLKDLPAGRYVLRVEARTLQANGATAAREVEFRVR